MLYRGCSRCCHCCFMCLGHHHGYHHFPFPFIDRQKVGIILCIGGSMVLGIIIWELFVIKKKRAVIPHRMYCEELQFISLVYVDMMVPVVWYRFIWFVFVNEDNWKVMLQAAFHFLDEFKDWLHVLDHFLRVLCAGI